MKGHDNQRALNIFRTYEMKCRKLTRILFYYGFVQVASLLNPLIVAILAICMGTADTSKWPLPLPLVLPFDTQSLLGWFLDWFFQFNVAIGYNGSTVLTTTHLACFCYYIIAACDYFDLEIESLPFNYRKGDGVENTIEKEKLQRSIQMHANIYV